MKPILDLLLLAVMATGNLAVADSRPLADEQFVTLAAQGHLSEAQLGELAQEKASAPAVKELAARLAADHRRAYAHLLEVGRSNALAVPTGLDEEHQRKVNEMRGLPAADFDRQFLRRLVKEHAKGVPRFRQALHDLRNPELKAWGGQTLPTQEEHLHRARRLARQTGVDGQQLERATGRQGQPGG